MFLDNQLQFSEDETSLFLRGGLSCPMLGPSQELGTVIGEDVSALKVLGYSSVSVACAISNLFSGLQSGRMGKVPGFRLECHEEIFLPPCPLCGVYENVGVPRILEVVAVPQEQEEEIYRHVTQSGEKFIVGDSRKFAVHKGALLFSKLHPHLIGKHSFFEGQGPYRLEPDKLIPFLQNASLL